MTKLSRKQLKYLWAVGVFHRIEKNFSPGTDIRSAILLEGTKRQMIRSVGRVGASLKVGEISQTHQLKIGDKLYPIMKDKNLSSYPIDENGKIIPSKDFPDGKTEIVRIKPLQAVKAKSEAASNEKVQTPKPLSITKALSQLLPTTKFDINGSTDINFQIHALKLVANRADQDPRSALRELQRLRHPSWGVREPEGAQLESLEKMIGFLQSKVDLLSKDPKTFTSPFDFETREVHPSPYVSQKFQEIHTKGGLVTVRDKTQRWESFSDQLEERILSDLRYKYPDEFMSRHWDSRNQPLDNDFDVGGKFEGMSHYAGTKYAASSAKDFTDFYNRQIAYQKFEPEIQAQVKELSAAMTRIQKDFETILSESEPVTRTTMSALGKILESGRFKTQIETNTSKAFKDADTRLSIDEKLFDFPKAGDPTKRPIYGYLGKADGSDNDPYELGSKNSRGEKMMSQDQLLQYGDLIVSFKPEMRNRTTMTAGDSLDQNRGRYSLTPTPLSNPDAFSQSPLTVKYLLSGDALKHKSLGQGYQEAQLHGGVSVSDIKHVTFRSEKQPSKTMLKKLDSLGITYSILPPQTVKDEF